MADLPRIVSDPEVCGGKPIIRGSRITVRNVLSMVKAGKTVEQVMASYPRLVPEDIEAALDYAIELVDEVRLVTSAA